MDGEGLDVIVDGDEMMLGAFVVAGESSDLVAGGFFVDGVFAKELAIFDNLDSGLVFVSIERGLESMGSIWRRGLNDFGMDVFNRFFYMCFDGLVRKVR